MPFNHVIATAARRTPPARWLHDHGVGPVELARALGVSTTTISNYCRGTKKPPVEFLAAVELAVGYQAVREFEALLAAGDHRDVMT